MYHGSEFQMTEGRVAPRDEHQVGENQSKKIKLRKGKPYIYKYPDGTKKE